MQTNDFEKAMDLFLETKVYDEAHNAVYSLARKSFEAGWKAAGGEPPAPHKIFEIVPGNQDEPE